MKETINFLFFKGIIFPEVGIVLGTGFGEFIKLIQVEREIKYSAIPNFPVSTVEFHKGRLMYGKIGEKKVLVMQGRFHSYEGYSMQQITFPIRLMKQLGVKYLFLSNAAGGINPNYKKGDIVLIDDHINLQGISPLAGKNIDELGDRFPDMSQPYSTSMNEKLIQAAKKLKIKLKKGVYASVTGPQLETRAEYRFLKTIGADMVGMSTVPEVIVANHMKLPCCAVSVITDECNPDNLNPVNIKDIIDVAGRADLKLSQLFANTILTL